MKIYDNISIGNLSAVQKDPSVDEAAQKRGQEALRGKDKTRLSGIARQISEASKAMHALPGVREKKISIAKERLANRFYDTEDAREELVERLVSFLKRSST